MPASSLNEWKGRFVALMGRSPSESEIGWFWDTGDPKPWDELVRNRNARKNNLPPPKPKVDLYGRSALAGVPTSGGSGLRYGVSRETAEFVSRVITRCPDCGYSGGRHSGGCDAG